VGKFREWKEGEDVDEYVGSRKGEPALSEAMRPLGLAP
jgi:hypothetical protein